MDHQIEIYHLAIFIDKTMVQGLENGVLIGEGELPGVKNPFKINLVSIDWDPGSDRGLPRHISMVIAGCLEDLDWNLLCRMILMLDIEWKDGISQWSVNGPIKSQNVHLDKDSQFWIDDCNVNLVNTLNRLLTDRQIDLNDMVSDRIDAAVKKFSRKYFGSDLIINLLKDLFYDVSGDFLSDPGQVFISASHNPGHFQPSAGRLPCVALTIPTVDFEYFVNHLEWPLVIIKGYELRLHSVEVVDDNQLEISLKELSKGWNVILKVYLVLRENYLYPRVDSIRVQGLNILEKAMFTVLKGLLISQIENHPFSVTALYRKGVGEFEKRYPFLSIQPGYIPHMTLFSIDQKRTEIAIRFDGTGELNG